METSRARSMEVKDKLEQDPILELSKLNYLDAQAFLAKYWETDSYKRLEAQFKYQPNHMSADDYILFTLSRREGQLNLEKLLLSYQETGLSLNEETVDHLTLIIQFLQVGVEKDEVKKHILLSELSDGLARRMLRADHTLFQRSLNWLNAIVTEDRGKYPRSDSDKEEGELCHYGPHFPHPYANPELFPTHKLLIKEMEKIGNVKDERTEMVLLDSKPLFLNLASLQCKNTNLLNLKLYGLYLRAADFFGSTLPDIFNSDLRGANLSGASIQELSNCYLYHVKFNQAKAMHARLTNCNFFSPEQFLLKVDESTTKAISRDFFSPIHFTLAFKIINQNMVGSQSFFKDKFERKVVSQLIEYIKVHIPSDQFQLKMLEAMLAYYHQPTPEEAFNKEYKKEGWWSATKACFFAVNNRPDSIFDPAVDCAHLIESEIAAIKGNITQHRRDLNGM